MTYKIDNIGLIRGTGVSRGTDTATFGGGDPGFNFNTHFIPGEEESTYYCEMLPAVGGTTRDLGVKLGRNTIRWDELNVYIVRRNFEQALSDDRIKTNEVFVENATDTLLKLKPQTYDKHIFVYDHLTEEEHSNVSDDGLVFSSYSNSFVQQSDFRETSEPERPWRKRSLSDETQKETGLIAQDIWYDAPELRHIVSLSPDADPSEEKPVGGEDPQDDPDYDQAGWGSTEANVSYTQLIPLLIKSNQELHERIKVLEAKP